MVIEPGVELGQEISSPRPVQEYSGKVGSRDLDGAMLGVREGLEVGFVDGLLLGDLVGIMLIEGWLVGSAVGQYLVSAKTMGKGDADTVNSESEL